MLRLERILDIDERRVLCSARDADLRRAFFAEVRSVLDATAGGMLKSSSR